MKSYLYPNPSKPTLVGVPGLLGGPEDFKAVLELLPDLAQILLVDPNHHLREVGLARLNANETAEVTFDSSAEAIARELDQLKIKCAYFLGISLGGKVIYDFAIRFPERFLGAVITDVAPSSFFSSDLFQSVDQLVADTDLNLGWTELKAKLREQIPDRNLRSLIQTQISYPNREPPAVWKTGMRGLRSLLESHQIDNQSEAFKRVDERLMAEHKKIRVLLASNQSGITPAGRREIEQEFGSIELIPTEHSSHFLHVTHKAELAAEVVRLVADQNA